LRALLAFAALISLAPPVVLSTFGATDTSSTNKTANKKTSSKKTAYKKKTTAASAPTVYNQKSKATASTAHAKSAAPVSQVRVSKPPVPKAPVATAGAKKSTSKSRPQVAASYRRSAQQQPTPDRYREIQQALADKGYFPGTPDGEWGASSVDALKRFQHDQNLTEDGKIGSVSLIALGLGPKRETPAPPASPPDTPQPTSIP
jgi:peptidoglycan hydrolase-like protein with peptidoglycan-binding domain